jgi:TPR repeat protein
MKNLTIALAFLMTFSLPVSAQDFQKGLAAEQGKASSQSSLGIRYEYGEGVLQDNVMAHMWYNIASANGHSKAGEWRDERAGLMTQADISKAQAKARECMNSDYKKCGY